MSKLVFTSWLTLLLGLLSVYSHPAEAVGEIVSKIKVSNTRKIEPDAIKAKLKTKVGDVVAPETLRSDVQAIFDMGYFYNVEVQKDKVAGGVELTYKIQEKPSITEVVYEGNSRVEKDDIEEASGIKPYTILDQNKLREAQEKLSKFYEEKGFFLARINYSVQDVKPGEEVKIVFKIKENDKVKVKKITFLGNHAITDPMLKSIMQTKEGGFFSFMTGTGAYKQDVFDRDVALLQYIYYNKGYVQVKVDRPQVTVTPDKKSIFITVRVEEGEQFNVGKVEFSGDLLFSKEEFLESTEIQNSDIFVFETLQKDLSTLQYKYGDLGYAFANIIPKTNIRDKDRIVDVTFEIEKGQKVYFGDIKVTGNTKTRDKVVRRELRILEGELYNETRKRRSEENVKRLGYFTDVIFNTSTPSDQPNILNLDIQVKERSTGTIQVGAGYSTAGGFLFNGQISQTNLFGRGQTLSFSVNVSNISQTYNLGFTEPYLWDTQWTVGFDAYKTERSPVFYREVKRGGDVRFGYPLGEYFHGYITYKLDETEIHKDPYADPFLYDPKIAAGYTSSVTGSLVFDKRNDRFAPTSGYFGSVSLEQAGLGGDLVFSKGFANARYYKELFWKLVLRNNLNYGFVSTPTNRRAPFSELFLLGGANSLRGFNWFSIGKKALRTCCAPSPGTNPIPIQLSYPDSIPYGGTQQVFYQAELEFPLISEAQIKGVFFYDTGMAEDRIDLAALRQDAGFGFRWFSPIGPLRFEWGFPLDRRGEEGEPFSNFEFSIGAPF